MNEIFIPVIGIPAPQGSKRHVGHGIMIENSKRVKPWRQDVKEAKTRQTLAKHRARAKGKI